MTVKELDKKENKYQLRRKKIISEERKYSKKNKKQEQNKSHKSNSRYLKGHRSQALYHDNIWLLSKQLQLQIGNC